MELLGFDRLIATCRALGIEVVWLKPPATAIPGEVHGQPLDPQLAALLRRTDGAYLSGRNWAHYIYGSGELEDFGGPDDLADHGGLSRLQHADWPRIGHFIVFGGFGHQSRSPATVPALAAADGTQPVVELDINEELRVTPLASSVDRWLDLTVRYLERVGPDKGTSDLSFPSDVPDLAVDDSDSATMALLNLALRRVEATSVLLFPWEVPDLLAEDSALVALLKAGAFAPFVGEDRFVNDFIARVIKAHDSNVSRLHNGGDGK